MLEVEEKFDPYVINYNFVTTEPIFKIRNSAESYCLAESEFSAPKCQNTLISAPPLACITTILFTCGWEQSFPTF